jgi:hypothetical protein
MGMRLILRENEKGKEEAHAPLSRNFFVEKIKTANG